MIFPLHLQKLEIYSYTRSVTYRNSFLLTNAFTASATRERVWTDVVARGKFHLLCPSLCVAWDFAPFVRGGFQTVTKNLELNSCLCQADFYPNLTWICFGRLSGSLLSQLRGSAFFEGLHFFFVRAELQNVINNLKLNILPMPS